MTPADVVAITEFNSGAVRVRQDFTGDRKLLRSPKIALGVIITWGYLAD